MNHVVFFYDKCSCGQLTAVKTSTPRFLSATIEAISLKHTIMVTAILVYQSTPVKKKKKTDFKATVMPKMQTESYIIFVKF